jgi:hypothetical protein
VKEFIDALSDGDAAEVVAAMAEVRQEGKAGMVDQAISLTISHL